MKTSILAASAASLVGSVAGSHVGFHVRRGNEGYAFPSVPSNNGVCTVYTTVFVNAPTGVPQPPAVANLTQVIYPSPVPASSSSSSAKPVEVTVYPSPLPGTSKAPEVYPSKEAVSSYVPPPVYTVSASSSPAPAKSSAPAYSPPASSSPVYSPPAYSSAVVVSSASPKPSSPSYGGNGGRIVTKGDKWAITYTPYTSGGMCKSAGEVQSDIKKIADMGFTTIRVYSTDCYVFENVAPACKSNNLKIIFGIFLEGGGKSGKGPFSDYANKQLEDIKNNAPKDIIAMIICGNEFLFNGYGSAEDLASYITYVRQTLQGAGFPKDIAITTTEPVDVWQNKGSALCSVIDVFTVQVHPFFTSKISASNAGDFAKEQLETAAKVCPDAASKGKYISEIGWPKAGESNGAAIPGQSEQKDAISSILAAVGTSACLFSFQDDKWKAPGAFGVEQNFGCSDVL